jgi:HD-GYP domain-containing protein (c-di-GMP phosphodiesterase class II)
MNRGAGAGAAVGEPFYCEPLNGPAVILSTPVLRDGRRVGVIVALASFAELWRKAGDSSGGYTLFALNRDGGLFTKPEGESTIASVPYPELEVVRQFVKDVVKSDSRRVSRVMPYRAQDVEGREIRLLGAYAQTRLGWGVFVQADEDKANYLVGEMKWNTWFHATMAAIGAVIAGVIFAGWISRPIKRLADSSLAFAEGDFHSRVTVRSGNEVGELAETFNVMAETLEKYIARLKHAAEENSQLFVGSIRALAAAIDEKDAYTRGHSERVRRYAATLARAMDLPPQEIWKTEIGALLHDVGKIGIQDCVLNKPGPLTQEEYEIMKTHPVRGANIMGPIGQLRDVIPVMKHHHERWDGGGYPDGLAAEEIPISTRLVTIADCWDAMTTNRPYQEAMDLEAGVQRLQILAGKAFDPEVAKAFVGCLRRGELDEALGDARRQVEATDARLKQIQADETTAAVARKNIDPDCLPPPQEVLRA